MNCSLYIHIPFCKTKCDYCDFFSVPCGNSSIPDEYISSLCKEITARVSFFKVESFKTVYIGGGTPSLLSDQQLSQILSVVYSISKIKPEEITVEVNPDDVSPELLESFEAAGVNRLSVGIQAFDDVTLKSVKRRSSLSTVYSALDLIKKSWKGIFSADIICALPNQTKESFLDGLGNLVGYEPHHISMYSLTIEDETPLGRAFNSGDFEYDFDAADEMWIAGREFLEQKGYVQYEVSNFSKPGFECKHNMVYWKLHDYIGCGAGATGTVYGKDGFRFTNTTKINEYISYWNDSAEVLQAPGEKEVLDKDVESFEFFMMGLRTLSGVCRQDYETRFGCLFPQGFVKLFDEWKGKGFANVYESQGKVYFSLNKKGILFLNAFLEKL